ncbi:MAG: T9SS type A sorting domain-containing protein [Ignavibacteria bacterium]|nr:T9SS type A sorting domain-containing protein [Ignavibacteria bacterium]
MILKYTKLITSIFLCIALYANAKNLSGGPNNNFNNQVQNNQVKVLAVMVEFAKDNDAVTVGDGTFKSIFTKDWGVKILDPLPHDTSVYYENHLLFAKNYYEKLSHGLVSVNYKVFPVKITLPKTMKNYSPPINSDDFSPISEMMTVVWHKVDSVNALIHAIDFKNYNLFAIFHAGVGRDVSLPGSIGNERDIPSIYMSPKTLASIPGFPATGISVQNGEAFITNSMILPQTENREVDSYGQKSLVQVSINGLIVSNIGSFLGLPDLFNTKTGVSAIGRFGLMDGQSIFAYAGTFMPEPSAWEKIALGWETPVIVTPAQYRNIRITARASATAADTVIYMIPITKDEYFLIENRQRDVQKNGARITTYANGRQEMLTFKNDTTGFVSGDVSSLYGVITDVDEYDWALPGSGILIWHIDDKIIREKAVTNSINNDKARRGVCLMEADGVKDIGNQFYTVFGDLFTGEGTADDFWYADNKSTLYKNIFNTASRPNSNANDGGSSLISVTNFSAQGNSMTCRVAFGSESIKPVMTQKLSISGNNNTIASGQVNGVDVIAVQNNTDSICVYKTDGTLLWKSSMFSKLPIKILGGVIIGVQDTLVHIYKNGSVLTQVLSGFNAMCYSADLSDSKLTMFLGSASGRVAKTSFDLTTNTFAQSVISQLSSSAPVSQIVSLLPDLESCFTTQYSQAQKNSLITNGDKSVTISGKALDICYAGKVNNAMTVVILTDNNTLASISEGKVISSFAPSVGDSIATFSLIDLKQDGNPYIVFQSGKLIYAYTITGALAENFPVVIGEFAKTTPHRVMAYYDNLTKQTNLLVLAANGLHQINALKGEELSGYPVSISAFTASAAISNLNGSFCVSTLDSLNNFAIWQLADRAVSIAAGTNGYVGNENRKIVQLGTQVTKQAFLPSDKVYNYPNPVYGGVTNIRYYTDEEAEITVKIFDISGDLVTTLHKHTSGKIEEEVSWNVNSIQSGVYLARVEASGISGKNSHTIIKIAVIK